MEHVFLAAVRPPFETNDGGVASSPATTVDRTRLPLRCLFVRGVIHHFQEAKLSLRLAEYVLSL